MLIREVFNIFSVSVILHNLNLKHFKNRSFRIIYIIFNVITIIHRLNYERYRKRNMSGYFNLIVTYSFKGQRNTYLNFNKLN